jgi:phosphoenolpyruvate carboxylase
VSDSPETSGFGISGENVQATAPDRSLSDEVRWLGEQLGQVILDLEGAENFELEELVRSLSKARRRGEPGAGNKLREQVQSLSIDQSWLVCRAFSNFFDLANLAEDRHRVEVLRRRESERSFRPESIAAATQSFVGRGYSVVQVQSLLEKIRIEPVFTAHPTEAKRRAVRNALRRIRLCLSELDHSEIRPKEQARLRQSLREDLETLWLTDPLVDRKPTVLEEVDRGLYFMRSLWKVAPLLHRDLKDSLAEVYPGHEFRIPAFLHFGTWMGGDRDGNPFVTTDVTSETLRRLRKKALKLHCREAQGLEQRLTHSELRFQASTELVGRLQEAIWQWPRLTAWLDSVSPQEIHRRWVRVLHWRLRQSLHQLRSGGSVPGVYRGAEELLSDLALLDRSLGQRTVQEIENWRVRVETFGFHLAALDVRQEAGVYRRAQTSELTHDPEKNEVVSLFKLLAWASKRYGRNSLGCHILSMTRSSQDVLCLMKLQGEFAPGLAMPLVPLFETIQDLLAAPRILEELFTDPDYRSYLLEHCGSVQRVMIGYSDSTKDGGYLAANWCLYQAQQTMLQVAAKHGVQVQFFHGRGGALGRGGGPAARSILSLPPTSCDSGLRITEQGEVLSARYDDPLVAQRHLEQLTWAVFEVLHPDSADDKGSSQSVSEQLGIQKVNQQWPQTLSRDAESSRLCYRQLVEHPGFLDFFRQATPIDGIEHLQIGSRPARRGGPVKDLSGLRAIPWVFSWTQNRTLLPAWYGLGQAFAYSLQDGSITEFKAMYRDWPFFTALIDNAVLALAKADLGIVREYAQELKGLAQDCWMMLEGEFQLTVKVVSAITGQAELLDNLPWLQRSIEVRNPYVDPLNFVQIETLKRLKISHTPAQVEECRNLLRMTIQGIAAGLRTTG